MTDWLTDDEWSRAQQQLPIVCVDAMPVAVAADGSRRIGLIRRTTPHQGERWCLLGGRVRRGERLTEAVEREWGQAFGDSLPFGPSLLEPPLVVEYLPGTSADRPHDPRKHAVALTYAIRTPLKEAVTRGAEALAFRWFTLGEVDEQLMGFRQDLVVRELMARIGAAGLL